MRTRNFYNSDGTYYRPLYLEPVRNLHGKQLDEVIATPVQIPLRFGLEQSLHNLKGFYGKELRGNFIAWLQSIGAALLYPVTFLLFTVATLLIVTPVNLWRWYFARKAAKTKQAAS